MRRYGIHLLGVWTLLACVGGCINNDSAVSEQPIETSYSFTNLSRTMYAQLEIRAHAFDGVMTTYDKTPLLAPGGTHRARFLAALNTACPTSLDLRVLLFDRVNGDIPIGLDAGEAVNPFPVVAGEIFDVPACGAAEVETYTIVNWDAPAGTARVKIAQDTPVETAIRSLGLFADPDAAWEFEGSVQELADAPPQPLADVESVSGRVITVEGVGVEQVGVLIRSRFRARLNDDDPNNDPDAGYGDPIDVTATDVDGRFSFDRPGGAYRIEVFSDDFLFRPPTTDVESPLDTLLFIAEPLP